MKKNTKSLVSAALFAALVCVATMIVKIPSPLKGYINLGDCMVLLAGWILPPVFSFPAAGIGSALADVFSGYFVYAPVTFVIKGLVALAAFFLFKLLSKKTRAEIAAIVSGFAAEAVMVAGYYVFEGFMYGFGASAVNILPNVIQGAVGIILGTVLLKIFSKTRISL
ncbi:MAG: ECF transporter S component [Clostridia bacterium]|nr:ECF transporter S component [Clostridia bacterium]